MASVNLRRTTRRLLSFRQTTEAKQGQICLHSWTTQSTSARPYCKVERASFQIRSLVTDKDKEKQTEDPNLWKISSPPSAASPVEEPSPQEKAVESSKSSAEEEEKFDPHLDRNFITATRAVSEFLLLTHDLKGLEVTKRRSPNERDPPLNCYRRKEVVDVALKKWGSMDTLEKEKERRERMELDRKLIQKSFLESFNVFTPKFRPKRKLKRASWPVRPLRMAEPRQPGLKSESGKVVLVAIGINTANCVGKLVAWIFTGSHAMFSEAVHSLADTLNQVILAYGIRQSEKQPNKSHPYGYSNMQYVSSLISGVGIFCVGSGLSIYHGVEGLWNPHPIESIYLAFGVLGLSFLSESVTLALAIRSIRESAKERDMGFIEYVAGGYDPCVNVVLLEDLAAVLGVVVAAGAMGLSLHTGSSAYDAGGSLVIGGLLGSVASFMIYTNSRALVGRSIPDEKLAMINKVLEGDIMIRQVHDVKGIDMGNGVIRYKAEVDVDGQELAKYYLSGQDMDKMLKEANSIRDPKDLERFMLIHGEKLVDCLGEQVDRIEKQIKAYHPDVKHVDLEVL